MVVMHPALMAQATRPAAEQEPSAPEAAATRSPGKQTGVITGDRVNVRSGSDQNYYPITQLNAGDQVTIVGEDHGWLEILPPKGTYSLIEKTYVTADPGATKGEVNETVWVKAGGDMSTRRYAKQVRLGRGAEVTLLGETEDGDFYKISPPNGATLWVSGDFVDLGGRAVAASPTSTGLEPVKPGELLAPGEGATSGTTTTKQTTSIVTRTSDGGTRVETIERSESRTPSLSAFDSQHQIEIKALEAEIAAESTKPLPDQSYDSILERLEALAAQEDDEITRRYAESRLKQIRSHIDLINTLNDVRDLTTSAIAQANERQRARASIQADEAISADNIVVRGQIEPSSIYRAQDNLPQRWRVVEKPDPSQRTRDSETIAPRTLAYIEIPENSTIDPTLYVGKDVGIRAGKRRYIRDAIPPIPIYTVEQIVVMDQAGGRGAPSTRPAGPGASESRDQGRSNRAVVASPDSTRVAPPASQPAGAMKPVTTGEREAGQ
jgi:hypothetical protein